jgi:hypothetical protein
MYPPTQQHCQFGCKDNFTPNGRLDAHSLSFVEYRDEEFLARENPELWEIWKHRDRKYDTDVYILHRLKRYMEDYRMEFTNENMLDLMQSFYPNLLYFRLLPK